MTVDENDGLSALGSCEEGKIRMNPSLHDVVVEDEDDGYAWMMMN